MIVLVNILMSSSQGVRVGSVCSPGAAGEVMQSENSFGEEHPVQNPHGKMLFHWD